MNEKYDWKGQAEALFFIEHMSVNDICVILQKTRKYVSAHLQNCEDYEKEKEFRKSLNAGKRKEYKREWDRNNRRTFYPGNVTADTMRREHDVAVRVLSSERY